MGVPWWSSRLRIQRCHCCGVGLIPGLGTSVSCRPGPQKEGGDHVTAHSWWQSGCSRCHGATTLPNSRTHLHPRRADPTLAKRSLRSPDSLTPAALNLLSVVMDSPTLDVSHERTHTPRVLLCLASVTEQQNVLQVHPRWTAE